MGNNKDTQIEVIFNCEDICEITPALIEELKKRALSSLRRRARICLHHSTDHPTQEMLIVASSDMYMPPHRHVHGKSESYHLVEGKMLVVFFDDDGQVSRRLLLTPGGSYLYRLSAPLWHMPIPLTEWIVYHEVYTGPFVKTEDVEFPPWAPGEDQPDQAAAFVAELLRRSE